MKIELSRPMPPAQNDNNWQFSARVQFEESEPQDHLWVLPDFDLQEICVAVLGRPLNHKLGIKAEEDDLDKNWERLKPTLTDRARRWYEDHTHEF